MCSTSCRCILQALYFLTPILYPLSLVEGTASWLANIVKANPLTWFVETMHQVMYSLVVPQWWVIPGLLAVRVRCVLGRLHDLQPQQRRHRRAPMSQPFAVELDDVGKRFMRHADRRNTLKERLVRGRARNTQDFWAVRDVDLQIPKGSVYGLIGHNGSGKSTLLKLITGIYRPTEGSITTDGRVAALIELGAGFHPDMTGRENIRLNGSILGLEQVRDRSRDGNHHRLLRACANSSTIRSSTTPAACMCASASPLPCT